MSVHKTEASALATGGIAGLLASACCVGPLLLVSAGLGGVWVARLKALEPYRLWLIAVAIVALILAWRKIYRPVVACAPGQQCATAGNRRIAKITFWLVSAIVAVTLTFPYFASLFY